MKKIALLLGLALIAGCATNSKDLIDERTLDCAQTSEVMIRVGLDGPGVAMEQVGDQQLQFIVEISNNLDNDIVVKYIRIEQMRQDNAPYRFDSTYRAYDELIAEGDDHTFELPTTGRRGSLTGMYAVGDVGGAVAVSVGLANGDQYRCAFAVGSRR